MIPYGTILIEFELSLLLVLFIVRHAIFGNDPMVVPMFFLFIYLSWTTIFSMKTLFMVGLGHLVSVSVEKTTVASHFDTWQLYRDNLGHLPLETSCG